MRVSRSPFLAGAMLIATAGPTVAIDRWETVSVVAPVGDDDSSTVNEPKHGATQVEHDLDSTSDQDWIKVVGRARRSYEARVWSGSLPWQSPACPPGACAGFDMVTSGGVVVIPGAPEALPSGSLSVRWTTGNADALVYLRAQGNTGLSGASLTYDLGFYDTTMFLARFNNVGTQTTVVILQSTRPTPVGGAIHFYDAAGTHLHAHDFTLQGNATLVLSTATVPALQNVSGSAQVAHTAGYGGLAGKAVALEPSTGYAFDTPLTPLPY
jgi:hypothetical protein